MARGARLPPQLVQSQPHGGPVDPSAGLFALRARAPPQLPKRLHGEFFGARVVAHHPADGARDTLVVGVKERFKIERTFASLHLFQRRAACVHTTSTPASAVL